MTIRDLKYELQNLEDMGYGDYTVIITLGREDASLSKEDVHLIEREVVIE